MSLSRGTALSLLPPSTVTPPATTTSTSWGMNNTYSTAAAAGGASMRDSVSMVRKRPSLGICEGNLYKNRRFNTGFILVGVNLFCLFYS